MRISRRDRVIFFTDRMSGCNNDEAVVDQSEKRKSIEAAMGDVLGKESSSKPDPEKDLSSQDQGDDDGREEADGAPAESFNGKKSEFFQQTTVKEVPRIFVTPISTLLFRFFFL